MNRAGIEDIASDQGEIDACSDPRSRVRNADFTLKA
jgi:hypothetical protein